MKIDSSRVSFILLNFINVFLVIFTILLSLVPPVSRDALVHHLAIPKLYLENGGFFELPCMSYSYYPMNLDILYMFSLYLGNDIFPKIIHFLFAILTSLLIFYYLNKRLNKNYASLGILLFLSTPIIIKLSTTAYVDLGLVFFSTASLILLFEWVDSNFKSRYIISSAIFCGLALGTKYNGLISFFLISLFSIVLYSKFNPKSQLKSLYYGLIFIILSLSVFSPWMVRNYIWKGNPIYPLYNKYFNINNDNPCEIKKGVKFDKSYSLNNFEKRKFLYNENFFEILILPVRIFFQGKDNNFQHFDGQLSALLFFLPLLLLIPYGNKNIFLYELKIMFAFSVLFFLFVFFSSSLRIRYFAPSIPFLVILSVFGVKNFTNFISKKFIYRKRIIIYSFFSLIIIYMLIDNGRYLYNLFNYIKPFKYLTNVVDRDEYISMFREEYHAFEYINKKLPKNSNILFFYVGKRGYYCDREYIPDEGKNLQFIYYLIKNYRNPHKIEIEVKKRGITHFLFNNKFVKKRILQDLNKDELIIFLNFINLNTKKMYDDFGYSLYKI